MPESDATKEWFVTHEGKQFGPVSINDLKFEVERGELNPRLDMVWKSGMEEWIPAGELDGLFAKNTEAKAAEKAREESKQINTYVSGDTQEDIDRAKGKPPGVGRGSFFFFCCIFPVLWGFGISFAMTFLEGKIAPDILKFAPFGLMLVPLALVIAVFIKRLQNLGMSPVWFVGLFVPLLGLWVKYRAFACPPGYALGKKLDGLGWALAVLYWIPAIAVVAAVGGGIYLAISEPEQFEKLTSTKEVQQVIGYLESARDYIEELRGPEEKPKPAPTGLPSIY